MIPSLKIVAALSILLSSVGISHAYTVVTLSTGVPVSIEKEFVKQTTTQFSADITVNPFVSNTYAIKIFGRNPNYNAPITDKQLLDSLVTVDSYSYVYGYANGMEYQNRIDEGIASNFFVNCSTASQFNLIETSTKTFDFATCQDVTTTMFNSLYQLNYSTPTAIGGFQ